jgi:tetratricopeptide (TPR) repeat protein
MGRIHRKLAVIAVVTSFITGCADETLGPEYGEVGEEESGLQFYAPGLADGYRKFIYGQDDRYVTRTIGVYGPKQGEYPHAQLILIEMPPRLYFSRTRPPQDTIKDWKQFEARAITSGPTGTAVNAIGRIDYAAFLADNLSCAVFRQPIDTIYGTGGGKQLLDGYYCEGEAPMMTEGDAVALAKAIGHRKYGAIEAPHVDVSAETYAQNAVAYARAGDQSRAIDEFSEAIRLEPGNAKYYRGRGNAYRGGGNHDLAIQDYAESIRLDPTYARAYNSRGIAYKIRYDYDLAIENYDEAIRLDPRFVEAYNNRGSAYHGKRAYDRAIQDYNEAIRLDATYARAYANRGYAYQKKGDNGRAIRDFDEAIRLDPAHANTYNNRCWIYGLMRRPDKALEDCNEGLRLQPDSAATLDSRALAYWLLGDHDNARRDLIRAREINPRFAQWQDRFREFEGMF